MKHYATMEYDKETTTWILAAVRFKLPEYRCVSYIIVILVLMFVYWRNLSTRQTVHSSCTESAVFTCMWQHRV